MKERPILFSGPMVRAILEGRKTQTRRIVKAPKRGAHDFHMFDPMDGKRGDAPWPCRLGGDGRFHKLPCPYGQPGDRLWVRETWMHFDQAPKDTAYKADVEGCDDKDVKEILSDSFKRRWKPSIHMHRHRSRITLEIESVRVERLQEISTPAICAEGLPMDKALPSFDTEGEFIKVANDWYRRLWESINGPDSWNANPFVWVVTFTTTK